MWHTEDNDKTRHAVTFSEQCTKGEPESHSKQRALTTEMRWYRNANVSYSGTEAHPNLLTVRQKSHNLFFQQPQCNSHQSDTHNINIPSCSTVNKAITTTAERALAFQSLDHTVLCVFFPNGMPCYQISSNYNEHRHTAVYCHSNFCCSCLVQSYCGLFWKVNTVTHEQRFITCNLISTSPPPYFEYKNLL